MYFEYRNKQFKEEKTRRLAAGKMIIKRIKVNFISRQRVSAMVGVFVKQVLKKQWLCRLLVSV